MEQLSKDVWQWFEDRKLNDPVMQTVKINEEVGEICHEISRGRFQSPELIDAIGDTFVTLIGLCHHTGLDIGECLAAAYEQIKDRTGKVINGSFVKDV